MSHKTPPPTASNLKNKKTAMYIQNMVDTQIELVDNEIIAANDGGINKARHKLPTVFNIAGISDTDVATMVCAELIKKYKTPEAEGGRGFTLEVTNEKGAYCLYLSWPFGINRKEVDDAREVVLKSLRA